jgi:hypothetical protein
MFPKAMQGCDTSGLTRKLLPQERTITPVVTCDRPDRCAGSVRKRGATGVGPAAL